MKSGIKKIDFSKKIIQNQAIYNEKSIKETLFVIYVFNILLHILTFGMLYRNSIRFNEECNNKAQGVDLSYNLLSLLFILLFYKVQKG